MQQKSPTAEKTAKLSDLKAGIKTVRVEWRFLHALIDSAIIEIIALGIAKTSLVPFNSLLLVFPLYYLLFESLTGRTLGKYISKTVVVDNVGNPPKIKTVLLRTLFRFVPFEPLSCLDDNSRGWHDRWSKTYVIQKSYLPHLRKRIADLQQE